MDITAAAIATLIASGIATSVTFLINRGNNLKNLNDQLDNILKLSFQYPYLENPVFTATWNDNKNSNDEKYLRYDIYCNLVFNYMERLCKYYNFNEQKIQKHINIKEWIKVHKDIWNNPSTPYENADGYSQELKTLIQHFLQ
jgi:hypothetical protein